MLYYLFVAINIIINLFFFSQRVKPYSDQSGLGPGDRPITAISPTLPFSGASPTAELDVTSQQAECDTGRDVMPPNVASKSETQEPASDKPSCASAPAAEVARIQDYSSPQPIPPGESNSLVPVYK